MSAADHNPVLASWALVYHSHDMIVANDVSPYDAWEAFQDLYNYDLVSSRQYNRAVEVFSSLGPSNSEIQRVLSRVDFSCTINEQKDQDMSTKLGNPFSDESNAIVSKSNQRAVSLPPRQSTALGNPFSTGTQNLPEVRRNRASGDLFGSPEVNGLSCQDPMMGTLTEDEFPFELACTGLRERRHQPELLVMERIQRMDYDGDEQTNPELTLDVFQGTCPKCDLIHHNSVGQMIDPGSLR